METALKNLRTHARRHEQSSKPSMICCRGSDFALGIEIGFALERHAGVRNIAKLIHESAAFI